jgi:hypothetical protein
LKNILSPLYILRKLEIKASYHLVPILPAHDMSREDFALAARLEEA